jgi:prepilin-type N-terminal cleavage/methylation domain-containing protein
MKRNNKGFTVLELLVSVSIIGAILSVVFWNYGGFNDNLAVSGSAQEMAIAIRQAQTYGINVKETSANSNSFNSAYGIYFNSSIPGSYRIFVDLNGNNSYDSGESVEQVTLRNGIIISAACDASTCPPASPAGVTGVNVTFLRPSPDARIYFTNSSGTNIAGPVNSARVRLTSPKNKILYVNIEVTGQVTIQ